jgi:hypothetical protein
MAAKRPGLTKVIFLDIDGVLNNRASAMTHKETGTVYNLHRPCVELLSIICENTGAVCVVSSTWRRYWNLLSLEQHMNKHGFSGRIVDKTPTIHNMQRGDEIKQYLNKASNDGYPVDRWVILDDDSDMGDMMPYLIQTNTEIGLTLEHADKAIAMIGHKNSTQQEDNNAKSAVNE